MLTCEIASSSGGSCSREKGARYRIIVNAGSPCGQLPLWSGWLRRPTVNRTSAWSAWWRARSPSQSAPFYFCLKIPGEVKVLPLDRLIAHIENGENGKKLHLNSSLGLLANPCTCSQKRTVYVRPRPGLERAYSAGNKSPGSTKLSIIPRCFLEEYRITCYL